MSELPGSAMEPTSSATASIANVFAAMAPIFCAIASCLPIARPHWTRSLAHTRAISRQRLPAATDEIGSVSRPVLRVIRPSFRPLPTSHTTFSFGTRTLVKRMTPLYIAFRPMKWQRCSTFTPGQLVSTRKAVICRRSLPSTILEGVRAITTMSSARVPLVHHSFSPFRIQACPSSLGTAIVSSAAGSDPTPGSVSANAEMAPWARRGRYFFFCASVPNSLSGWGAPMDWWAESSAVSEPSIDDTSSIAFMYESWDSPSPPDRKSTRLNSSHSQISYAVFCLKKKKNPGSRIHEYDTDPQDITSNTPYR